MILTIKSSEFKHIEDNSSYNHNYYEYVGKNANKGFVICEICHEDYNFCEFWGVEDDDTQYFLGCSYDYIHDNAMVNINFREYYT